ncbi:MAG: phosphatase PAP2 family protein [Verrucomicrobiota bacterium]
MKMKFHSRPLFSRLPILPTLSLILFLAAPAFAEGQKENYLPPHTPDGIALLSPPPAAGSAEQAADLALSESVVRARTEEEVAQGTKSASLSIFNFAPAIGDFFQPGKFPKMEHWFNQAKSNTTAAIDLPKEYWKRPRPYELEKSLLAGKPERNASYPSGHSVRGTLQALMLAELFPEKREAILEYGRKIGWDRVIIGKHFYTDVVAGRVLAQAIMRELLANENFKRDLAGVKEEIAAAIKKN